MRPVALVSVLLLTGSVAFAPPGAPAPPDVARLVALAADGAHPAQGPLLALAVAAGVSAVAVEAPSPEPLAPLLLELYVAHGVALDPLLAADAELASSALDARVADVVTPALRALVDADPAVAYAVSGATLDRAVVVHHALRLAAASEAAMRADVPWPPEGWTDPLGLVRIGGAGSDTYTVFHYLSIDPRGDDVYLNNGGATWYGPSGAAAALAVDLEGDDLWTYCDAPCYVGPQYGAADLGLGIAIDAEGNDTRDVHSGALGYAAGGLGAFLDLGEGADWTKDVWGGTTGKSVAGGLAFFYDEGGGDGYDLFGVGLGHASVEGVGFYLDGGGGDDYSLSGSALGSALFAAFPGGAQSVSLFVEDGGAADVYPAWLGDRNDEDWLVVRGTGKSTGLGYGYDGNLPDDPQPSPWPPTYMG